MTTKTTGLNPVRELRVVLTVDDYERAIWLYQDAFGLDVVKVLDSPQGRGVILAAGRATLEIVDRALATSIDHVEVGARVSGAVRLALEFGDVDAAVQAGQNAGAQLLHEPVITPWQNRNARLMAGDGMQLTLFQRIEGNGNVQESEESSEEHEKRVDDGPSHTS